MSDAHFPHLGQPITLAGRTLRNRIVMGSMHTGLESASDAASFERLARFYALRARGGAGLIVTGGYGPNAAGRLTEKDLPFDGAEQAARHRVITGAVHEAGGTIVLQLVHAGRYAYHGEAVAPSPIKSPINRAVPREMSDADIRATIDDYVRAAQLAHEAGYDGVEVMGSEGYLISQFLAPRTNHRQDIWGGSLENRARFPVAVVAAIRAALGRSFLIVFRHSVLDLVEGGLSFDESVEVARRIAAAGADLISSGIGWHEARVPTIAGAVPHAAFAEAIRRLKAHLPIPVSLSNRINTPEVAERLLASGCGDMVALARPMLADADFAAKALGGHSSQIMICIACNQACLDHYFEDKVISCLVNPAAADEASFASAPAPAPRRIAVIGGGMAGLAAAREAARRGHGVTVFEAGPRLGGQMMLAAQVPGKADYASAVAAFAAQLAALGVEVRLNTRIDAASDLAGFDAAVLATGIRPRRLDLPGADDPRVMSYEQALDGARPVGGRVAIIGGGGIGHDVALTLALTDHRAHDDPAAFAARWGIGEPAQKPVAARQVTMLKRQPGPFGRTLGKSTGWILRQDLADLGVRQIAGVAYDKIDGEGLHIHVDGGTQVIPADSIVVCAGQESEDRLAEGLAGAGIETHVIGGARLAGELDAKRAVAEGAALGCRL